MGQRPNDMRAIVRPSAALEHFTLERWSPEPPIDRFVDRFWKTEWDLPKPFVQSVVTYPTVNLVFQSNGSAVVSGPQRHNDHRHLSGTGWAFGVMFRPGGFRPFISAAMKSMVDLRVPASDIFRQPAEILTAAVLKATTDKDRRRSITEFLTARCPAAESAGETLSELIEAATGETPPVTRVSDLAARGGVSVRTLQRVFAEHVGLAPKAVLDRYRVQTAAEMARNPSHSWAEVAHRLGYADQAHLTAALTTAFGAAPATYARREAATPIAGAAIDAPDAGR